MLQDFLSLSLRKIIQFEVIGPQQTAHTAALLHALHRLSEVEKKLSIITFSTETTCATESFGNIPEDVN